MKSVSDEFDVFDERASRVVDVASVLASNAELTDLLTVLQRERDQLDLLLDVTNAVVTHLDTRELFRAVAPALRRCVSADVAAKQGRLGRSWGCPALSEAVAHDVIDFVRGGGVIFSYYPDQAWLDRSRFLHCNRDSRLASEDPAPHEDHAG